MQIIYKDRNILAINKPAGLVVHGAENLKHETLADWLIKNYPEVKSVGDDPNLRPGIVHRLDKDTSGVLVVARNQKTFEFLKKQFKDRTVKKTYVALVKGEVKNKKGKINTPVKLFTKSRDAATEYKVIKKILSASDRQDYTLLEVYPKTGRTHQIRIHLKSIKHPIVCEKLYTKKLNCPFGLTRHFLHAKAIELTSPDGARIKLETGLPDDLRLVLRKLKGY